MTQIEMNKYGQKKHLSFTSFERAFKIVREPKFFFFSRQEVLRVEGRINSEKGKLRELLQIKDFFEAWRDLRACFSVSHWSGSSRVRKNLICFKIS